MFKKLYIDYRLYTYHIAMVLKQLFTLPTAEDISEFTLHISAWSFGPNTTNQATMRLAVLVMWSQWGYLAVYPILCEAGVPGWGHPTQIKQFQGILRHLHHAKLRRGKKDSWSRDMLATKNVAQWHPMTSTKCCLKHPIKRNEVKTPEIWSCYSWILDGSPTKNHASFDFGFCKHTK